MDQVAAVKGLLDDRRIARLGAALWYRAGARLEIADLDWTIGLLGPGGNQVLWNALVESGAISSEMILTLPGLARFLSLLSSEDTLPTGKSRLVWTLPEHHPQASRLGASYRDAILEAIETAQTELLLTSPFLQEQGIALLAEAILRALYRGVRVTIVTHSVEDLGSEQSKAIERLRREAVRLALALAVYSADITLGCLLHAKLAIADESRLVVGSANLTGSGLGRHFEAGAVLGRDEALVAKAIISDMIDADLARCVLDTRKKGQDERRIERKLASE